MIQAILNFADKVSSYPGLFYAVFYLNTFVAILVLQIVLAIIGKLRGKKILIDNFLAIAVAFSYLGLTMGILVGNSREPAVNALIPAILSFFGAITIYIFFNAKYNNPDNRKIAGLCLILISVTVIVGADIGDTYRMNAEQSQKDEDYNRQLILEQYKTQLRIDEMKAKNFYNVDSDKSSK